MLKIFIIICISICGFWSTPYAFAQSQNAITPAQFNYYADDYPPASYVENGEIKGASVEILKLMWETMGIPEQEINVVPWARSYRQALSDPLTVLFSMIKTKDRVQQFKWVGPIFSDTQVLVARKDFNNELEYIEDCFEYTVATIRQGVSEQEFSRMGFPVEKMVKSTTLHQAIKLLYSERVDLMLTTADALDQLTELNGFKKSDFKIVMTIGQDHSYFAFNRSTPDYIIEQFQRALDNIEPVRLELIKKYNLEP